MGKNMSLLKGSSQLSLSVIINQLGLAEHFLVGSIPTPLKNMKVSWDDDIPNIF